MPLIDDSASYSPELPDEQTEQARAVDTAAEENISIDGNRTEAGEFGRWSEVVSWPVLAVHAALLPNGKVMAWDATPDDFDDDPQTTDNFTTRVTIWDPLTESHLDTPNDTNADLFCAGSAHLWDGRVLFAGGDSGRAGRNGPLSNSSVYDPWTNAWTQTDSMATPRWYSSVAALSSGEMLTFGGTYSPRPIAEVFKFNQQWRDLPLRVPFTISGDYSWLQATSSGDVMYLGPHNTLSRLETHGDGHWNAGPERDQVSYRGYGSYALFDVDKALVVGGGDSTASSVVVDMSTQETTPTSPLTIGRRQHNLTVLADGSVLATGGNSSGETLLDMDNGVLTPEVWHPDTGKWEPMADMEITRQYHSTALLLPDGRVLSAGGGYCAVCGDEGYHAQNAEVFSPPYLFDANGNPAKRPTLANMPEQVNYATTFLVQTDAETEITRAHLIKLGSVTHSQNQDQRLVPVAFLQRGSDLLVLSPRTREIAPPGHYLLYVLDADGTPSLGKIIQIGQPLISADEVVVNSVREERWDYYAIKASGEHTMTVFLQGSMENVDLMVNAESYPTSVDAVGKEFDCASNTEQLGGKLCVVRGSGDTLWYIGVYGRERADYSLVASIDQSNEPRGIPILKPSAGSPATPENVRAEIYSETDADLYWDPPVSDNIILNYEVFRDGRLIAVENNARHSAKRLQPEQRYEFQIVAVDVQQNRSAATEPYPVVTLANPNPDLDAQFNPDIPSAPGDVRIKRYSSTALEIFWEPSIDNGFIAGYEIYRDGILLDTREGVSYYDRSLQPAEEYTYTIVAVDNEGHRSLPSMSTGIELPYITHTNNQAPLTGPDTVDTSDFPEDDYVAEAPANDDVAAVEPEKKSSGSSSVAFILLLLLAYQLRRVHLLYPGVAHRGKAIGQR